MTHQIRQEADRFVLQVDGVDAGFAQFREEDGRRLFTHTEIDDAYSGQGLSSPLVQHALESTRDAGLRIVPVCPLVKHWLTKHPELGDVVDAE